LPSPDKGKAIVTAAPNEFHELGGRILADMLEAAGWDVFFLGANTPDGELIKLVGKVRPRFLAISLTMPFSIDKVAAIISKIKSNTDLGPVRILVGGSAFNANPHLWRQTGADAWAEDLPSAIRQVTAW
jgi:methanogenic corrinoid protein MtbC1